MKIWNYVGTDIICYMSLIDDMGVLYMASRMERLSATLKKDADRIYKKHLKDIRYKWYPVLYSLYARGTINVVELAYELSYAHPTIIDVLKEMEAEKLIKSIADPNDNRRRVLSLTAKGKKAVEKIMPVTKAFETAATALINSKHHLLKALEAVETELQKENFYSRVDKLIK